MKQARLSIISERDENAATAAYNRDIRSEQAAEARAAVPARSAQSLLDTLVSEVQAEYLEREFARRPGVAVDPTKDARRAANMLPNKVLDRRDEAVNHAAFLLSRRAYSSEIIHILTSKYKISKCTAYAYMKRARALIRQRCSASAQEHRNDSFAFWESVIRDPNIDITVKMKAQQAIDAIMGTYAPDAERVTVNNINTNAASANASVESLRQVALANPRAREALALLAEAFGESSMPASEASYTADREANGNGYHAADKVAKLPPSLEDESPTNGESNGQDHD